MQGRSLCGRIQPPPLMLKGHLPRVDSSAHTPCKSSLSSRGGVCADESSLFFFFFFFFITLKPIVE